MEDMNEMRKYRVAVVDENKSVLRAVVDMLLRDGFDAEGYDEAEKLLVEEFDTRLPPREPPDLVLIDLELKPRKMQGLALVAELTARNNLDSALVVMSGRLTSDALVEATRLGAGAGLPKPFDRATLISTVGRLASTARLRRSYRAHERTSPNDLDPSRLSRPVFLSYSSKDDVLANGLRLNIEARGYPVWYAPTTIAPGNHWKDRIQSGIGEAKIFVALLTDNYFASSQCVEEAVRFMERMAAGPNSYRLVLPVLSSLSENTRSLECCQKMIGYQYVDISKRYIDGLTALLLRIEGVLGPTPSLTRKARSRDVGENASNSFALPPPHPERSFR
jgi:FixJ family two-component response regulator